MTAYREERRKIESVLPVFEELGKFLEQVAAGRKPLLTKLVARPKDGGEETPIISIWAAYGEANPIDRIEELNRELEAARRVGRGDSVA